VSTRDGNAEIYTINVDGSGLNRLTDDPGNDWVPDWSPDGSRIAFVSERTGSEQIYVMNDDGSGLVPLTYVTAGSLWSVAWSPDGSQIAFMASGQELRDWWPYVVDAGGGTATRLSAQATENPIGAFAWAPDGSRIALVTGDDANGYGLSIRDPDGAESAYLLTGPYGVSSPTWSPDGATIAYADVTDGSVEGTIRDLAIFADSAYGLGMPALLTTGPEAEACPAWSPDGSRIAYYSGEIESSTYSLEVMDADGQRPAHLTVLDSGETQWWGGCPAWSPDGSFLALAAVSEGQGHLFVVSVPSPGSAEPATVTQLTHAAGPNAWPSWAP
jgi:TolB protein